ncbi:MAG TPA: alkaline phosphatase PhoX [Thermoleophilaceae bacterium]|nr:alkaline phosphatase PhoX [Thermoleophilaceae bacterium]
MAWTRRELIGAGVGGVATVAVGAGLWRELLDSAPSAKRGSVSGYGPRRAPNEHGLRLPEGFRSRVVARGDERVAGTGYDWHLASDGMATFPVDGGGWILVSNSETLDGGASAIRFARDGEVADAYRILSGTLQNCSGGGTPWGTWLSCEEVEGGHVWECDPSGRRKAVRRPALGAFKHEAAAVDPRGRRVYLTEDLVDGGFYRFTPRRWPDLSEGLLEIATVARDGAVTWTEVPDPAARVTPTRRQVPGSTALERGEGLWRDGGTVYVATTADHRVHAYDIRRERFEVIYDGLASRSAPLLRVDQLTASRAGEIFVCEDLATDEIDIGMIERSGRVSRFLSVTGAEHVGSELTGVTFDPTGSRMYFASQRAGGSDGQPGPGAIYEVSGPFRGTSQRVHSN